MVSACDLKRARTCRPETLGHRPAFCRSVHRRYLQPSGVGCFPGGHGGGFAGGGVGFVTAGVTGCGGGGGGGTGFTTGVGGGGGGGA